MLYFCHFVLSQEVRSDDAWSALQVAITRFWMLLVEHVPESVASWLEDWYGALMEEGEEHPRYSSHCVEEFAIEV